MLKRMIPIILVLISFPAGIGWAWEGLLGLSYEDWGAGFGFGAKSGYTDGYDDEYLITNLDSRWGVMLQLYRTWGESPAFYAEDYRSPIPAGGSRTWPDIWLWSQNYTPRLGSRTYAYTLMEPHAPSGYWGRLFLDYVPDSLGWTGPWYFDYRLDELHGGEFLLPVPITDNPYDPMNVTRMHLTVYTTPIPEPSSLLALGGGVMGLAGLAVRRRRR